MKREVIDYLGLTKKAIKLIADLRATEPIRILSGEDEYEEVRVERNRARDEYQKNGSRGAIALVERLDKVLENYERSK